MILPAAMATIKQKVAKSAIVSTCNYSSRKKLFTPGGSNLNKEKGHSLGDDTSSPFSSMAGKQLRSNLNVIKNGREP